MQDNGFPVKLTLHLPHVTTRSENNTVTDVVNLNTKKADGTQTTVKTKKMIDQVATPTGILQIVNDKRTLSTIKDDSYPHKLALQVADEWLLCLWLA